MGRRDLSRVITLRSIDDVHRFRDILDIPPLPVLEPVSDLVYKLQVEEASKAVPWLHLIFFSVLPALPSADYAYVFAPSGRTGCTLCPSLPRSLPGSIMVIEGLHLKDVHFSHGRTLSRLLSSIPLLIHFIAFDITFDAKPIASDFLVPPFARQSFDVSSNDSQLLLSLLPLVLSLHGASYMQRESRSCGPRFPNVVLDDEDLKILEEFLGIFHTAQSFRISFLSGPAGTSLRDERRCFTLFCASVCRVTVCASGFTLFFLSDSSYKLRDTFVASRIDICLKPSGPYSPRWLAASRTLPLEIFHVHMIEVYGPANKLSYTSEGRFGEPNWAHFVKTVLRFPRLQRVECLEGWERDGFQNADDLAFIGITEAALKPLVEAGIFASQCADWTSRKAQELQTGIDDSNVQVTMPRKVTESASDSNDSEGGGGEADDCHQLPCTNGSDT